MPFPVRRRGLGEIAISFDIPKRWRLEEVLVNQPGLRIIPGSADLVMAGRLEFTAEMSGKTRISDSYEIEIRVHDRFPQKIPVVFETKGRIPLRYHHLQDGSLCLGSETRLRFMLSGGLSLAAFVERCIIPYLYRYSHLVTCGEAPFDDLAHGVDGIKEDLRLLLGLGDAGDVLASVRLLGMKKRLANKEFCPCRSGSRVGRCHHRSLNVLRERVGRYWFRIVEQQLLSSVPSGKSSRGRSWPIRWREDALLGGLPEKLRRLDGDGRSIVEAFSTHAACPSSV
ncbi:MAG TPA: hypothetical protein VFI45_03115 [Candidatus Acidoferrum sp.]|nr:hypothetical protein [Candidatus Acidoferrum sp.]